MNETLWKSWPSPRAWIIAGVVLAVCVVAYVSRDRLLANNAQFQLQQGNVDEALRRTEQARQAGLDERKYLSLKMQTHLQAGDFTEVLQAAENLESQRALSGEERLLAVKAALELNDESGMRRHLSSLKERPDISTGVLAFAEGILAALDGDNAQSLNWLMRVKGDEGLPDATLQFFRALWLARAYRHDGQTVQAFVALDEMRGSRPDSLDTLREDALCHLDLGMDDAFQLRMDQFRHAGGNVQSILAEMSDCAEWLNGISAQGLLTPPPSQMALYLTEAEVMPRPEDMPRLLTGLSRAATPDPLITQARALEKAGRVSEASQCFKVAQTRWPNSFAANFYLGRNNGGSETDLAGEAEAIAKASGFVGRWYAPRSMTSSLRNFSGDLYSNGYVSVVPQTTPGSATLFLILSSTTVHGIGAQVEVRWRDQVIRKYVDSKTPTVVQCEIYVPAENAHEIQIHFMNDEIDEKTGDDRNLTIHAIGIGRDSGAGEGVGVD